MGLRETNKQDKRERLSRAAHELFSEQGFDSTTMRQIAERAGIGVGTIFLYARDKQGLLFLLFSEAVLGVEQQAFATLPTAGAATSAEPSAAAKSQATPRPKPSQSRPSPAGSPAEPLLLDQLVHVFSAFYRYYTTNRPLARLFVKELLFLDGRSPSPAPSPAPAAGNADPSDGEKHVALTMGFIGRMAALVGAAQARGELRRDFDPLLATLNFFSIYFLTLVGLLDPVHGAALDAELASERLRASLQLQISGLLPPAASRSRPRRTDVTAGSAQRPGRRK